MKYFIILLAAAGVVALPFFFRQDLTAVAGASDETLTLVVVTPHIDSIRKEFGEAFSAWHKRKYGKGVVVDWRMIGGTTEIMRYLASEYEAAEKRYSVTRGLAMDEVRLIDAPDAVSCRMDVFFGGGTYDHAQAQRRGFIVPAWRGGPAGAPVGIFHDADGRVLIPRESNGEVWYDDAYYGCVLSTFGICFNTNRLTDLSITKLPTTWYDLADARYFGTVGLADPTKSGSVAKAFEMITQTTCANAVAAAGFTADDIRLYESMQVNDQPAAYMEAIARGWIEGVQLIRRLAVNARYFTDSAGKVPIDVSLGASAAGLVIDFYGRLQAEMTTVPGQAPVMFFHTPVGGSSVNADPISLLRGAPHRELAVRFINFVLGEEGQRLWNYRVGTPGGPQFSALRRLPIRRDFYPSADPVIDAAFQAHRVQCVDDLAGGANAYQLSAQFRYEARWTARHFGILRDLIRAMCMDSGDELKAAWRAIEANGGPAANPRAMAHLLALPDTPQPLTWQSATAFYATQPRLETLRAWTAFFRREYRAAEAAARFGN